VFDHNFRVKAPGEEVKNREEVKQFMEILEKETFNYISKSKD